MSFSPALERLRLNSPSVRRKSLSAPNSPNLRIPIPIILKGSSGLNKTIILNFIPICHRLHRDPKHILIYFNNTLDIPGDITGSQLVINGTYTSRQIQANLKRYCQLYVMCRHCNLYNTKINKDNYIECYNCHYKFLEG